EGGGGVVKPDAVEGVDRLGAVQAVLEPEAGLVCLAALVGEEGVLGVQLFPTFGACREGDLERAREAAPHGVVRRLRRGWRARAPSRGKGVRSCGRGRGSDRRSTWKGQAPAPRCRAWPCSDRTARTA